MLNIFVLHTRLHSFLSVSFGCHLPSYHLTHGSIFGRKAEP